MHFAELINAELVSLIMPVINEDYVKDSISNICKQSYTNWELLVLACGPLKKIDKTVTGFNDPRIQFYPTRGQHRNACEPLPKDLK